jgi:hypothetical protein
MSTRSRSVRAAMQSAERNQTGAQGAASVSSERLLPERVRQNHAGQHGSIVEGPDTAERSGTPHITGRPTPERGSDKPISEENPNLAEHPADDSGGETLRWDGTVIGAPAPEQRAETTRCSCSLVMQPSG